jgi:hypothetical protein
LWEWCRQQIFDRLSHAELKSLVIKQFEVIAELQRTVAALRDEIARLKGGPRRPNIKPSGMDKATEPRPDKPAGEGPGKRGSTKTKLTIHEEKTVKLDAPTGSRFKGYTSYIVQDLVIRARASPQARHRRPQGQPGSGGDRHQGALWGSVKAHGLLPNTVIVSDDAGQFNVGQHGLCWIQYLESDLILSAEVEGLTWRGNHPEMTQDKNRRSKRPQERQEISLGFQWLGQIRLDADMLPEGLKDVALHPQVSRQVTAGRRQARLTKIVENCRQVGS